MCIWRELGIFRGFSINQFVQRNVQGRGYFDQCIQGRCLIAIFDFGVIAVGHFQFFGHLFLGVAIRFAFFFYLLSNLLQIFFIHRCFNPFILIKCRCMLLWSMFLVFSGYISDRLFISMNICAEYKYLVVCPAMKVCSYKEKISILRERCYFVLYSILCNKKLCDMKHY